LRIVFEKPAVYLITKGDATVANFAEKRSEILDIVRAAVDARITFVQLREKHLSAKLVYELACELAALTRDTRTRLLVNDRFDIALAAGAAGVQLTSSSITAAAVRASAPDAFVIGVSTHSIEKVQTAAQQGADFAVFGPVFATPGKEARGLESLKQACTAASLPVIAIGGVNTDNANTVIDAGAVGYAAIRSLNDIELLKQIRNN
jgi:thiamine-phosphate pyrophosphorylase